MQGRLLEQQVEEANRKAVIQRLEYQRQIKELDEVRQRELQLQQQFNIESLRREHARIAEIQVAEQARLAQTRGAEQAQLTQDVDEERMRLANAQAKNIRYVSQKSVSTQLTEIAEYLRESSPKVLSNGISLRTESIAGVYETCRRCFDGAVVRHNAVLIARS